MGNEVWENTSRSIKPGVIELANKALDKKIIIEANDVIKLAFSENLDDKKFSGKILSSLIPTNPKRPLYYVNFEVSHGPRMVTRHVVHYLCAYLNTLLDDLAKKLGGLKRFIPFGATLNKIKGKIPSEMYQKLDEYNKIFYVPAKHNFDPYNAKDHLFSLKDAIYCCYITMKLKEEIDSMLKH